MPLDRNGLEVLAREECLELLRTSTLGRVAATIGALPVVLPVNYGVLDGDIVFRTMVGTKLAAAVTNAVVAFEVDHVNGDHSGWSVLVTGIASEVTDADELAAARVAVPETWLPEAPTHLVRVRSDLVSGRRISAGTGPSAAQSPAAAPA